jgi:hypothetical protein
LNLDSLTAVTNGNPPWLTALVALIGPMIGLVLGHRLTNRRDERQARRADRERDRAERRRGYLGVFEAGDAFASAVPEGRGESALAELRKAATVAAFNAGPGVEPLIRDVVEAARRWVKVAATSPSSSSAQVEAAKSFADRLSAAHTAMRADVTAD